MAKPMDPWTEGLYVLAEILHTPVYKLQDMPISEYHGWREYLSKKQKQMEAQERGEVLPQERDLSDMSDEDILTAFKI